MNPSKMLADLASRYVKDQQVFTLNAGERREIAPADPNRWALYISTLSGVGITTFVAPETWPQAMNDISSIAPGCFWQLPVDITSRDWPGIVQDAWSATSVGGVIIYVCSVRFR